MTGFSGLWRRWRKQRATVEEFERLPSAEFERIAKELGMTASELRRVLGLGDKAADLLLRRMQTLGLNPQQVDPAVMRDLQRSCACCSVKSLCAHELEDRPKGASWPKYCPNELTLRGLSSETQQHGM